MANYKQSGVGPREWQGKRIPAESWPEWQQHVVAVIRRDYRGVLDRVDVDDIDWDAWRPLYDEGRSAKAAVASAFGKVA
jgi:hypothetical protein